MVLCVSIYLKDGVGMDEENWKTLRAVGCVVALLGVPYVVAGDFNMSPVDLANSGWPNRIHGEVIAPADATCRTQPHLNGSTLDYSVVSDRISKCAAAASAMRGWNHGPHVPVLMKLDGDPRKSLEIVMRAPRKFPKDQPIGCARPPLCRSDAAENFGINPSERAASHLSRLWEMIEFDMLGIFDIVGEEAAPYCGRGRGPKFSNRPVLPLQSHGGEKQTPEAKFLRWVAECAESAVKRAIADGVTSPFFPRESRSFDNKIKQLAAEAGRMAASPWLLQTDWADILRRQKTDGLFFREHLV